MRERTISALVDLLKNKESTIQDWKGRLSRKHAFADLYIAFGAATRNQERSPRKMGNPLRSRSAAVLPAWIAGPYRRPNIHAPPALKANRDFLPGSWMTFSRRSLHSQQRPLRLLP
jgi:hypothetical protein